MSDSLNPQNLGQLPFNSIFDSFISFNASATLSSSNSEDTYTFNLPTASDFNKNLNEVELVYDVSTLIFDDIAPILFSFGSDSNNNGDFEIPGELIGSQFELSDGDTDVTSIADLVPTVDLQTTFLSPDADYFVELENQNETSFNPYDIDFDFAPAFAGTIDTNDSFYCCDSEDDKYYHDDLTELTLRAGQDGLVAGSSIDISLVSEDFDPVIFVTNSDTGEVIEVEADAEEVTQAGSTFNVVELEDFIIDANTTYLVSVETRQANQTGDYALLISNDGEIDESDISGVDSNISSSQTINGNLETSDTAFSTDNNFDFSDDYLLNGATVGETVTVRLTSTVFDTYLEVYQIADDNTVSLVTFDDDDDSGLGGVGFNTNSTLNFTVESGFDYVISAGGFDTDELGAYTLTTL